MGRASAKTPLFQSVMVLFAMAAGAYHGAAALPTFERDVQPILAEHCYKCHGPDKQKGGLRLDLKEKALEGGDSGKVILPGKGAGSLLVKLISGLEHDKLMPPKGERLTPTQITVLKEWIDSGAAWPEAAHEPAKKPHWGFQAPKSAAPPFVENRRWVRNAIDAFVLARLESLKLPPSPEADRVTLVRRLYLGLIGLLPTPEEVRAVAEDKRADAYERLVDSLLQSPHFGERWGRH